MPIDCIVMPHTVARDKLLCIMLVIVDNHFAYIPANIQLQSCVI